VQKKSAPEGCQSLFQTTTGEKQSLMSSELRQRVTKKRNEKVLARGTNEDGTPRFLLTTPSTGTGKKSLRKKC